ncbi:MAG: Stk1 family PASTA domain-containing Ser/Thr kinase [Leucobacter sp.]
MTSVPSDPLIGQTLDGRYAIRSRVARGGMAMVYLANDLRLERRVAVKVMHEHLAEDENFTRRFEREARSAAGLSHPNLVNVFDQGHDRGRTYLVMEYLPSITLRELLKQQKRLTADQTMEISEAVLSGLAAAHHAGIVHRDLKPENVLLADDGRIKLGDFGLARAVSANTTTGQALLGTIAYLSPELVTRGIADERSDLYAFGIMLYEMLTGSQPFTGEQPMQIAYQHAHSEVPLPSEKSSEASPGLDDLVRWTTQRDPELRPRDAGEVLAALSSVRGGGPATGATRVLTPPPTTGAYAPPTTTVLGDARQTSPTGTRDPEPQGSAHGAPAAQASPIDRAAAAARDRRARGRVTATAVIMLIAVAGGLGWWFGQGPGSRISIPDVSGTDMADAQAELEDHSLLVNIFECSSLDVPVGQAVRSELEFGTRVDRGSTVGLCQSTGPELLPVPTIAGLSQQEAEQAIADAHFTVGDVLETRFSSDAAADTVLAALDENGEGLGETYLEQGRVDLILSAGPVPDVAGLSLSDAEKLLADHDLSVDAAQNTENFSADVPEGSVIALHVSTDPVRPGDAVGLDVSLGPEPVDIPDVAGMPLEDAMQTLTDAGFEPFSYVPEIARGLAEATGTDPEFGEQLPLGSEIRVKSKTKNLFGDP